MSGQGTDPLVIKLFEEYCKAGDPDVIGLIRRCGTIEKEEQLRRLIAGYMGLNPAPDSPALIMIDPLEIKKQTDLLEAAGRIEKMALAPNFLF